MARVLLVDDEAYILTVLSVLFRSRGDDVEVAQGGQEALCLLEAGTFDLMISDIRMTPMNGMELLAVCRERYPALPVIMVTAYDTAESESQASELGAVAYLRKPFDNEELLRTAAEAMALRDSGGM